VKFGWVFTDMSFRPNSDHSDHSAWILLGSAWIVWGSVKYSSCRAHLPKVGFVKSTDEFTFSFVDPANVVCGCHLVPAFHEGHTVDLLPVPQSISQCLNPGDDDNWVNFYVNI